MKFSPWMTWQVIASPLDYLPMCNLSALQAFLMGFDGPLGRLGITENLALIPPEFNARVRERLKIQASENSFGLCAVASQNDAEAFALFAREFQAFVSSEGLMAVQPVYTAKPGEGARVLNLYDQLEAISKDSRWYLRQESVLLLRAYVNGWRTALSLLYPGREETPNFKIFERWLADQFTSEKVVPWERLLLFQSGWDEFKAFRLFFEQLAQFRRQYQE